MLELWFRQFVDGQARKVATTPTLAEAV
jgi:hypothetical protein